MKVHARKRKMEARRAALEAGERLAEMAGVEPSNTNTNTSEETGEGSPNDSSKRAPLMTYGLFRQSLNGTGAGIGKNGHCIFCQTSTVRLM